MKEKFHDKITKIIDPESRLKAKVNADHYLFLSKFKSYLILPNYLRWKFLSAYQHFSKKDPQDPELTYFKALDWLYDIIDQDQLPDVINDDLYLQESIEFREKFQDVYIHGFYNKNVSGKKY